VDRQTDAYGRAPPYLSEHCTTVFSFHLLSAPDWRRRQLNDDLRSTNRHLLAVPRFRLINTHGRRAFSVAGPMAWNSLPDYALTHYPDSANNVIDKCTVLSVSDFADKELHGQ